MKGSLKYHRADYRKYYQKVTGHILNSDLVVHHLDGDWTNCRIENLIAIDTFIHRNYHIYLTYIHNGCLPKGCHSFDKDKIEYVKEYYDKALLEKSKRLKEMSVANGN